MEKDFTVDNLLELLNEKIPLEWSEEWDNSGLQIGSLQQIVRKIVISFNPDREAVSYAIEQNADVLLTHHPLFFSGVKNIKRECWPGDIIYDVVNNGLSVIALHTNFDKAPYGISVNIVRKLGWGYSGPIVPDGSWGLGVVGELDYPLSIKEIAERIKNIFRFPALRIAGDYDRKISKYALCGGSCGSLINEVMQLGVELFITSDVKYHDMLDSYYKGLSIISVDHSIEKFGFFTIKELLEEWLYEKDVRGISLEIFDGNYGVKWM